MWSTAVKSPETGTFKMLRGCNLAKPVKGAFPKPTRRSRLCCREQSGVGEPGDPSVFGVAEGELEISQRRLRNAFWSPKQAKMGMEDSQELRPQ